jgi:hypothetical protein
MPSRVCRLASSMRRGSSCRACSACSWPPQIAQLEGSAAGRRQATGRVAGAAGAAWTGSRSGPKWLACCSYRGSYAHRPVNPCHAGSVHGYARNARDVTPRARRISIRVDAQIASCLTTAIWSTGSMRVDVHGCAFSTYACDKACSVPLASALLQSVLGQSAGPRPEVWRCAVQCMSFRVRRRCCLHIASLIADEIPQERQTRSGACTPSHD